MTFLLHDFSYVGGINMNKFSFEKNYHTDKKLTKSVTEHSDNPIVEGTHIIDSNIEKSNISKNCP